MTTPDLSKPELPADGQYWSTIESAFCDARLFLEAIKLCASRTHEIADNVQGGGEVSIAEIDNLGYIVKQLLEAADEKLQTAYIVGVRASQAYDRASREAQEQAE